MDDEKHRMLYQGQDPTQARREYHFAVQVPAETELEMEMERQRQRQSQEPARRPLSPSSLDPPSYDDAMATAPALAQIVHTADHRRTFFAEPQHLGGHRLEEMAPYLVLPEDSNPASRAELSGVPPTVPNLFALTPQPMLGSGPTDIMCPACGQQGVTRLQVAPHPRIHVPALWLLSTFGWCCCACRLWTYLLNGCQWMTTSHYCCAACEIYPSGCCCWRWADGMWVANGGGGGVRIPGSASDSSR